MLIATVMDAIGDAGLEKGSVWPRPTAIETNHGNVCMKMMSSKV